MTTISPVLNLDARVCRSDRIASREFEGRAVVVTIDQQRLHTLNEVGSRVWDLLDGRSIRDIGLAICREFDVDEARAQADVIAFLRDLESKGAVSVLPAGEK